MFQIATKPSSTTDRIFKLADGASTPKAAERLAGVTLTLRHPDLATRVAARRAAWQEVGRHLPPEKQPEASQNADATVPAVPSSMNMASDVIAFAEVAFGTALTRLCAVSWTGVCGPEGSDDVPLNIETLIAAMADQDFYDAVCQLFVDPVLREDREANEEKKG